MLLGYQTNSLLQAFPNTTITVIRAFLLIHANLNKVLTRKYMASVLGVSERSVTDLTNELVRMKIITKTRKSGYWNPVNKFEITMLGKLWLPALKNRYKVLAGVFKRALLSIKLLLSLSLTDFTLLKEDYIYNQPLECKLLTRVRARKAKMTMPINCKELKDAQELMSLSKWGVIRLTAYPTTAIAYAISSFRSSKSKKDDPFKWFCKVAEEWCVDNNIEPDWEGARQLARSENIPKNPEWTVEREPMPIPGVKKPWKPKVKETIAPKSEEEVFVSKVEALDKFKQMGELNAFAQILSTGFQKQIDPFMEK